VEDQLAAFVDSQQQQQQQQQLLLLTCAGRHPVGLKQNGCTW